MILKNTVLALFCGFFLSSHAHGEILFEAFYRLERNGRHSGYVVQRVSTDKHGSKVASTYIRTKQNDREVFVTSKSIAQRGTGMPLETIHYSNNTGAPYRITAKFRKGQGTVTFHSTNSRKPSLVEKALPSPFPSAFLFYAGDLSKFVSGKSYAYTAFAEEAGRTQIGSLSLMGSKQAGGKKVLQILNDDSGQPVENFLAESGEPLGSRSVATDSVCYWVATKEEAVGEFTYPTGEMTSLFGDLPQGKMNPWIKMANFKPLELIKSFSTWDSSRTISSSGKTPLPVRGL